MKYSLIYRRQKANLLVQNFNNLPSSLKYIIAKIVKNLPVKIFGRGIKFVRWSKKFLSLLYGHILII